MLYRFGKEERPPFQVGHLNLGGENQTEKLEVSNRYLIRNGACWTPVMGEIHCSRVCREDWKKEILKMKAGGITLISAYVIWIHHEEEEGVWDFSGNRDLRAFVQLVKDCGMKMVLRIGPWCHGEVRNGGFPDWLLKKDCAPRTDDPVYLAYVRTYYEKIYEQVKGFLFYESADAPIAAIQLENELVDNSPHLLTLKKMAQEIGLNVPIYTVTGWNSKYGAEIPEKDVLPVFGGYAEAPWEQHTKELESSSHFFFQPGRNDSAIGKDLLDTSVGDDADVFRMQYDLYPFATCELGGGIQVTHHRRPVMAPEDMSAVALTALGSGNNLPGYYMYHGGTNPIGKLSTLQESKATNYPNDLPVKSYDFQAPLGEYGQVRPHYRKLKCQNLFLAHFGELFGKLDASFQEPPLRDRNDLTHLRYSMRTDGEQGFVFVNNYQRLRKMPEFQDVQFEVPSGGGKLIFPTEGMTVPAGAFFFLPWGLKLGRARLTCATAQLLARSGDTWFFFAPDGVRTEYVFGEKHIAVETPGLEAAFVEQGARIVTLTQEQAEHFYELDGEIYLSLGDLYRDETGVTVTRAGKTDLTGWKWAEDHFEKLDCEAAAAKPEIKAVPIDRCEPYAEGREETLLSGEGARKMWEIRADAELSGDLEDVLLQISYDGDLAQLYVDGKLAADDFNRGIPWEVSLKAMRRQGSSMELLICEKKGHEVYMEGRDREGLALLKIEPIPVYSRKLN